MNFWWGKLGKFAITFKDENYLPKHLETESGQEQTLANFGFADKDPLPTTSIRWWRKQKFFKVNLGFG